jgi:3-oxoacyl-[acyl-carrier protein] reductase
MLLEGKVAIVTGGSRGIGHAVVTALAQNGCKVAFTYFKNEDLAQKLVEEWKGCVSANRHDVSDFSGAQNIIMSVCKTLGRVDILVNNAGILMNKPFCTMSENEWDTVINTNLKGAFNFTRAVIPVMMKNRWGRIVSISSVGGLRGMRGQTNYCASKAGIIALTRALAREVARSNITANAIAPGFIDTEMISSIPDAHRPQYLSQIPAGRFGNADDIAGVVLFLLTDAASYITGQVITVDGGLTA